jgi:hypothetical protein
MHRSSYICSHVRSLSYSRKTQSPRNYKITNDIRRNIILSYIYEKSSKVSCLYIHTYMGDHVLIKPHKRGLIHKEVNNKCILGNT